MRLERVHLHQVCQHANIEQTFTTGLVGILGSNGAGKSNFVNMILASLTGDFSINPGVKEDNVRWGMADDDYSAVTTTWSHNDVTFEVRRGLKNAFNYLKIDGVDTGLRNMKEITTKIEDILGIPKQLISFMFVPQWEMFSIIADDPATRASTFAHLSGTAQFERVYKGLTDQIKSDQSLVTTVLDTREELSQRLSSRLQKMNEYVTSRAEHRKNVLSEDDKKMYAVRLDNAKKQLMLREQRISMQKAIDTTIDRIKGETEAVNEAIKARNILHKSVESSRLEAELAQSALSDLVSHKEKLKRVDELKAVVNQKLLPRPPKPKRYDDAESVATSRDTIIEMLVPLNTIINTFIDGKTNCPTCGSDAEHILAELPAIQKERDTLVKQLRGLEDELLSFKNHEQAMAVYTKQSTEQAYAISTAKLELERIEDSNPVEALDEVELRKTVENYSEKCQLLTGAHRRVEIVTTKLNKSQGNLDQLVTDLAAVEAQIVDDVANEAERVDAEAKLAAHNEAVSEIRIINARLADIKSANNVDTEEIDSITAIIARSAQAKDWVDELNMARDFAHKDSFPKLAAQEWLANITSQVNAMLDNFDSPFRVEAGEDLTFIAIKPSGRRERADRLSGGEKVLLSLAFRFAVNSLMASDIGMMILDEPTAGVDKNNLNSLTDVLKNVSTYARDKGMQLIIITHDESLQRAFDQIITISKVV